MNKSELVDQIADSADISKADAGRALDAALGAITKSLQNADPVVLVGFGTFNVRDRSHLFILVWVLLSFYPILSIHFLEKLLKTH